MKTKKLNLTELQKIEGGFTTPCIFWEAVVIKACIDGNEAAADAAELMALSLGCYDGLFV